MLLHGPASKTNTSWLELILHPFGVGTSHGRPWTHLTHHGPNSREATTFPHIVFSTLLRVTKLWSVFRLLLPSFLREDLQ